MVIYLENLLTVFSKGGSKYLRNPVLSVRVFLLNCCRVMAWLLFTDSMHLCDNKCFYLWVAFSMYGSASILIFFGNREKPGNV